MTSNGARPIDRRRLGPRVPLRPRSYRDKAPSLSAEKAFRIKETRPALI
jgi:hypothetical protein